MNRWITTVAPLALSLAAHGQTLLFEGLDHQSLGGAALSPSPQGLNITNQAGGLEGVRVDLGSVEHHRIELDTPAVHPPGSQLLISPEAPVAGTPGVPWELRFVSIAGQLSLDVLPQSASVTSLSVEARSAGAVVGSWAIAPPFVDIARFPRDVQAVDALRSSGLDLEGRIEFASGPASVGGQSVGRIDELRVVASVATAVGELSATEVRTDLATIVLENEAIGQFGLSHSAAGPAVIDASGAALNVTYPSGPASSLSIDIGPTDQCSARIAPLGQLPAGGGYEFALEGELDGQPDQAIWTPALTHVGGDFQLTLDATAVQPTQLRVEVLDEGVVVAQQTIASPLPSTVLASWPATADDLWVTPFVHGPGGYLMSVKFSTPTWVDLGSGFAPLAASSATEIVVSADDPAYPVGSLSKWTLAGTGGPIAIEILGASPKLTYAITYCTAKASSSGCLAGVSVSPFAVPISGANDYSVYAKNVEADCVGRFLFSYHGAAAIPYQGGLLCFVPYPLLRGPFFSTGGTSGTCDGSWSQIVNDGNPAWDVGPGERVWLQAIIYDTNLTDGTGVALSNALQLEFAD